MSYVLIRAREPKRGQEPSFDPTSDITLIGVFDTEEQVIARVERMMSANPGCRLQRSTGDQLAWRITPKGHRDSEDPGFFGHAPVRLRAIKTK